MFLDSLLQGVALGVLYLLDLMGWKRAGKWYDQIMGLDSKKKEKAENSVV